ncbi:MAG: hypothetical protein ACXWDO_05240 [Bacteroidia bacterium]
MKKITALLAVILLSGSIGFAQKLPKFLAPGDDAGYMGLWDWGFSFVQPFNDRTIFIRQKCDRCKVFERNRRQILYKLHWYNLYGQQNRIVAGRNIYQK